MVRTISRGVLEQSWPSRFGIENARKILSDLRTRYASVSVRALFRTRLKCSGLTAFKCVDLVKFSLSIPLALIMVFSVSSSAGELRYSGNIFTGLTYTNNVILTSDGKEGEGIWEISPSISAVRDGKYVDLQFNYRLQGLLYAREDRRNEVYNYLQSQLQTIVVPDMLYLDAEASISQTVIDPLIASGNSSISTSGNSAETMTLNVSPYFLRGFGPSTELRLGADLGLIEYDSGQLVDNKQRSYFASLTNSGGSGPLNWAAFYNSTLVDYDTGQEIELARVTGEIGLRLGPRTEFVVSGGEDINDFGALPGSRAAEGSFWDVGFRGGFGSTIQFDVRVGEQFFGDSYSVQFTRTSRALETSLSYSEAATTIGAQQLDYSNALALLALTGVIDDQFDVNGLELPRRDPELYIRRRVDLTNSLTTGRSTWNARIFYEDRSFIRTSFAGSRENVQGAQFTWTWNYDDATTVTTSGSYQRLDSRDTVSRPQDYRLNLQVRRDIFTSSYIQTTTWYNARSTPMPMDEYEEIALRVGFGMRF